MKFTQDEWVVCRVFHKTTGIKKVPAPAPSSYDIAMAYAGIDQSSIPMPMPMPMQYPILQDFTMDPAVPFYSTTCASSMSVPPVMPPMAGVGSARLDMYGAQFGNPMANVSSMSFFHQMGMEAEGTSSFIATPESRPS